MERKNGGWMEIKASDKGNGKMVVEKGQRWRAMCVVKILIYLPYEINGQWFESNKVHAAPVRP